MSFRCHICGETKPDSKITLTFEDDQTCSDNACINEHLARLLMSDGHNINTAGKAAIAEAAREVIEFATRKGELLAAVEVRQFEPVARQ